MKSLKGKHIFGLVTVGSKGQIVIPKKARDIFGIEPGDQLILIGDEESGLAIITNSNLEHTFRNILKEGAAHDGDPDE